MTQIEATIAVGFVTVLMSGVVSSVVTYRLNRSKEHAFFMRQKAETLYIAIEQFMSMLNADIVRHVGVAQGKITYNELLDLEIKDLGDRDHDAAKTMRMLVSIYFPDAEAALQALLSKRNKLAETRTAFKAAYLDGGGIVDLGWRDAFLLDGRQAGDAYSALLNEVVRVARRHADLGRLKLRPHKASDLSH